MAEWHEKVSMRIEDERIRIDLDVMGKYLTMDLEAALSFRKVLDEMIERLRVKDGCAETTTESQGRRK